MQSPESIYKILQKKGCRCHLIGVGGSGMSGLAMLLLSRGCHVSGSDLRRSEYVEKLVKEGLKFYEGHDAEHVGKADLVIFSSAISEENVERVYAVENHIPHVRRASALAALCQEKKILLVAGMHGKSTSTAMLAHMLDMAERRPSYYVGGESPVLGASARWDKGEMVLEADESDGTIAAFRPECTLLLNIEAEHLDYFKDVDHIMQVFGGLVDRTASKVVFCLDDVLAAKLLSENKKAISYGFDKDADYQIKNATLHARGSVFTIQKSGKKLAEVELNVPGKHNVSNAAGVFALGHYLGLSVGKMKEALASYRGVKRRFDVLFENDEYLVVNDYAHHPTEIQATLAAAKGVGGKRVIAVFQPHRYSRTFHLREEFSKAFDEADEILMTEIYAASEKAIEGVSGRNLANDLLERGRKAMFCETLRQLRTSSSLALREGGLLLVMGAGDVEMVAKQIAEDLKIYEEIRKLAGEESVVQAFEPMSRHTSMRVGGPAQVWCEPKDEKALSNIVAYCHKNKIPMTVIGRGTNLIVRDGGIRGVCIHLENESFSQIKVEGEKIYAGAGARLKQIVAEAKKAEIGGLEFMEGIPATMGGALRMNAGIAEAWTYEVVESVRYMDFSGKIHEVSAKEIEVKYRSVPLFEKNIALSAMLKGSRKSAEEISAKLKKLSEKRWASQPAAPSAGCIFKNPAKIPAGKLIDELGLKNTSVGGAKVSDVHANFIVNEGGATAADVLTLIKMIQDKAYEERGVELQTEAMILGEEN